MRLFSECINADEAQSSYDLACSVAAIFVLPLASVSLTQECEDTPRRICKLQQPLIAGTVLGSAFEQQLGPRHSQPKSLVAR
jgi:hypothetical protein